MNESLPHAAPWHRGEVALQESVGIAGRMAELGPKVIRDHLIAQHREFFPLLPFVVIGAVDQAGHPWATLRAGPPGFLHAPDPFHLRVEAGREGDDPAEAGLEDGEGVALLGIELATRHAPPRGAGRLHGARGAEFRQLPEIHPGPAGGVCGGNGGEPAASGGVGSPR